MTALAAHRLRDWLFVVFIVAAVVFVYQPAWHAGFNWDDDWHLTANPCIVGPLGLKELWTTREAKICPLVQTTFWLEHALWGLAPGPYHLVNIVLHAGCALVLWRVLRKLRVPAAELGAALWALHPVQAESVAWITELKNIQSGFFFLLSILFFANFIPAQRQADGKSTCWYWASVLCAALAMASKSSTVILPLVLCLCAWWLEGRWCWRRVWNLLPYLPLSAAGCALSILTQRAEVATIHHVEWDRSWPERVAVAGKVVWFYLGKLVWPHPLIFFYPRWNIDASSWISYAPTAAMVLVLADLWYFRRTWARGMFFALAYFLIALLPVLGLVNHYFIRYSFVGDHFQYLACMGILALAGAVLARLKTLRPAGGYAICLSLLFVLAVLSWRQSRIYANQETLYNATIAANPDCWLAHYNLAHLLEDRGDIDRAISHYRKALELHRSDDENWISLGAALARRGDIDAAVAQFEIALKVVQDTAKVHFTLGLMFADRGDLDKALECYCTALRIKGEYPEAHHNVGALLAKRGELDAAIAQFEMALKDKPDYPLAEFNLANAFAAGGKDAEARQHYQKALEQAQTHNDKALEEAIRKAGP